MSVSAYVSCTPERLDEIRQLDENDAPTVLADAKDELLDEVEDLRSACSKWREIFTGYPHDAQQALRDLRERLVRAERAIGPEILDKGAWLPCTGCHASDEGHSTGPWSARLRCNLGAGCRECGGLGATWHPSSADVEEDSP